MKLLIVIATLTLAINANALECYSDETCGKAALSLVTKAAKKQVCKPEGKAALSAIRQKNFNGAAVSALEACFTIMKDTKKLNELEKAFK